MRSITGATMIHSTALIFTASLLAGCTGRASRGGDFAYRPVLLTETVDPLAPMKEFPAWRPPRQFAVWIHPHEDRDREVLVGGHWMLILLSQGSWYIEEETEREPVPDAEASREEVEAGRAALLPSGEAVVPYRKKNE